MRIVCISDTHSLHRGAFGPECERLPEGDILLCAGDITNHGDSLDVLAFGQYFQKAHFKYKITIAGNHDFCFEKDRLARETLESLGWTYLQDESTSVEGIKIYGSPWQPWFYNWAFNFREDDDGTQAKRIWDNVPEGTDILISHGPPRGFLDFVLYDEVEVGCPHLLKKVLEVQPMLHMFGHIHEGYGLKEFNGTTFCNASICTRGYKPVNKPFVFDLDVATRNLELVEVP